ncbi:MAG: winged helix-turn-helix transcriptional regulator [Candidatus Heimdallarchaeota archaeon]|nr:MAG: winged helix-turn-helix transcriptional regulator [Candidatus Heimdallarchaeota archaeon]
MSVSVLKEKLKDLLDSELVDWKSVPNRIEELKILKSKLNTLEEQTQFKEFIKQIKALNHPVRIQILAAINNSVKCPCELEYLTNLAQATVSHHLSLLEDAGLISRIREGKRIFLSIKNQKVVDWFISF